MLIALVIFLVSLSAPIQIFELRTLDMRFKGRGQRPVRSDLALVFIGDDSIRALGRWPWPLDYHALLVDVLSRHGARAVVFDIVFAEEPRSDDWKAFAPAVKKSGNVLLASFFNDLDVTDTPGWPGVGSQLTEPIAPLAAAARGMGHCNALPDEDGITRRVPLLVRYSGSYYPSTALLAALDSLGTTLDQVAIEPGRAVVVPVRGREPIRIPLDDEGQTLVNFAGDLAAFEAYSFLEVLQADQYPGKAVVDLERFRDKIVLVGVTFTGNTDLRPTPLSAADPMVCVMGNVLDNILQRDFIRREPFMSRLLAVLALGAVTGLLAFVLRPIYSLTASAVLVGAWVGLAVFRFRSGKVWIDVMAPLAVILGNYLVMTTTQYVRNRREKMRYIEYLNYMNDLVESTNDAIVSFDTDGRIVTWNHGAEVVFGWDMHGVLGKEWSILVAGEERPKVAAALAAVHTLKGAQSLEVVGLRRNGQVFPAGMNLSPVNDSAGAMVGVSCISQDLTERKKMVEMLVSSEKMAELGRLGSGIVHEIKNPLTSIMMLSGMVLAMESVDSKAHKYIAIIDQEAQRILRLSQNILSFARPKKPEMKPTELNRILEETLALVEYELKKNKVGLSLHLQQGGAAMKGDDEKLKQVFLNLIINAVHAMEGGGTLTITTRAVGPADPGVPDGFATHVVGPPMTGPAATVTITDQGAGISPGILDTIFEPFFTTKAEGKGTGLGLYITRNIILEHQGRLTVMSRVGMGTTFHIALPQAAPEEQPASTPPAAAAPRGA